MTLQKGIYGERERKQEYLTLLFTAVFVTRDDCKTNKWHENVSQRLFQEDVLYLNLSFWLTVLQLAQFFVTIITMHY